MEMDGVGYDAEVGTLGYGFGKRGDDVLSDEGRGRGGSGGGRIGCRSCTEETKDSGIAVVKREHGVEEMSYHCCSGGDGGGGIFVGGFCVANAENDVVRGRSECWDEGSHVWKFGGSGDKTDVSSEV